MTQDDHVDILSIAGIDHMEFVNRGEDVPTRDGKGRVFRRGSSVVYRAGATAWDDHLSEPHPEGN